MNIQISGNLSKPTVVFIAGWPDTCDVFRENVMAALAPNYRIVGINLPGFDAEHPFIEELCSQGGAAGQKSTLCQKLWRIAALRWTRFTKHQWVRIGSLVPFRLGPSKSAERQSTSGCNEACCRNSLLHSLGLYPCCNVLEPFRTSWKGHSFQDLVTLLEIAVDTAMETCNYCSPAATPTSPKTQNLVNNGNRKSDSSERQLPHETTNTFTAHQLPPKYTQPVLIAHDWGCLLAYELILARPGLFSRMVTLDVGAYLYDRDAAHIERMCDLISGQDEVSFQNPASSICVASSAPGTSDTMRSNGASPNCRQGTHSLAQTADRCKPTLAQEGLGDSLVGAAQSNLSTIPRRRAGLPSCVKKRSLATQYATRQRSGSVPQQPSDTRKKFFIVAYQFFLICCAFLLPHRLARWLLGWVVYLSRRPLYTYDPQIVVTPTMEFYNQSLNSQFFAQHPFAIENRSAIHVHMSPQTRETKFTPSSLLPARAAPCTFDNVVNERSSHSATSGWKIMLVPFVDKMTASAPLTPQMTIGQSPVGGTSHLMTSTPWESYEGKYAPLRKSTHSGRTRRYSLFGDWATDTSTSAHDGSHQTEGYHSATKHYTRQEGSFSDGANVIFSSYAKGAHLRVAAWESLAMETCGNTGQSHSRIDSSGKFDPYVSLNGIASPVWVPEDPLTLTGAKSFMGTNRPSRVDFEDDVSLLLSSSDNAFSRRGRQSDCFSAASTAGAGQMHVAKRRIFYQAILFPPLKEDASRLVGTSLSSDSNLSASGDLSSLQSSSDGGYPRESKRVLSLHAGVPVCPSPWQAWIYFRYWLGTFLLCVGALVSWLLGEKQSAQTSSVPDVKTRASTGNRTSSRTSSNVMTTAIRTIYRRLPATPLPAADVSTLPGNGDIILHCKSYAPLVTQRYFVPLPIPTLFIYGGDKSFMFHAEHWCSYLRHYQRPRDGISDVVEVQGGKHWFFAEKKYQKKVADRISEFLVAETHTRH